MGSPGVGWAGSRGRRESWVGPESPEPRAVAEGCLQGLLLGPAFEEVLSLSRAYLWCAGVLRPQPFLEGWERTVGSRQKLETDSSHPALHDCWVNTQVWRCVFCGPHFCEPAQCSCRLVLEERCSPPQLPREVREVALSLMMLGPPCSQADPALPPPLGPVRSQDLWPLASHMPLWVVKAPSFDFPSQPW